MSFLPLKDLLPRSVRSAGIADQVQAAQVLEVSRSVVAGVLPAAVAREVQPLHVRHNTLTLQVPSSAVAQELRLREPEILDRLNRHSQLSVERLRFRVTGGASGDYQL